MNVERLFAKHPPREPLTSIAAIIRDWTWRFGEGGVEAHRRDPCEPFTAAAENLLEAIRRACASRGANGKMWNHQSKVPEKVRRELASRLTLHLNAVRSATDFDALYSLIDSIAPRGIGPVTKYDVAARLAAFLKLEYRTLYLHAGALEGWCRLTGEYEYKDVKIPRRKIPPVLLAVSINEIEDLLCTYRELLTPEMLSGG